MKSITDIPAARMPNSSLTNSYMSKRKGVLLLLLSAWVGFCLVWFFTIYQKEEKKSIEDMAVEGSLKGTASIRESVVSDTAIVAGEADTTPQKEMGKTMAAVSTDTIITQDNKAVIDNSKKLTATVKDTLADKPVPTPVANSSEQSKRIGVCYFHLNSDKKIKNLSTSIARKLRRYMEPANTKIIITGHTDYIGAPEFNYQLGLQRAERVKQLLIKKGIAAERIVVLSKGEEQPVASNKNSRGRAQNRRVEINITLS
jgi:outer membrane protein OmpA-like peptidoglycan-associated protein